MFKQDLQEESNVRVFEALTKAIMEVEECMVEVPEYGAEPRVRKAVDAANQALLRQCLGNLPQFVLLVLKSGSYSVKTNLGNILNAIIRFDEMDSELLDNLKEIVDFCIYFACTSDSDTKQMQEDPEQFVENIDLGEEFQSEDGVCGQILLGLFQKRFINVAGFTLNCLQYLRSALEGDFNAQSTFMANITCRQLAESVLFLLSFLSLELPTDPTALEYLEMFLLQFCTKICQMTSETLFLIRFISLYDSFGDRLFKKEAQAQTWREFNTFMIGFVYSLSQKEKESALTLKAQATLSLLVAKESCRDTISTICPQIHQLILKMVAESSPFVPNLLFNFVKNQWHFYFSNGASLLELLQSLARGVLEGGEERLAMGALKALLSLTANKQLVERNFAHFGALCGRLLERIVAGSCAWEEDLFELVLNLFHFQRVLPVEAPFLLNAMKQSMRNNNTCIIQFYRLLIDIIRAAEAVLNEQTLDIVFQILCGVYNNFENDLKNNQSNIAYYFLVFNEYVMNAKVIRNDFFEIAVKSISHFANPKHFSLDGHFRAKHLGLFILLLNRDFNKIMGTNALQTDLPILVNTIMMNISEFETLYEKKILIIFFTTMMEINTYLKKENEFIKYLEHQVIFLQYLNISHKIAHLSKSNNESQRIEYYINQEQACRMFLKVPPRTNITTDIDTDKLKMKISDEEGVNSLIYESDQIMAFGQLIKRWFTTPESQQNIQKKLNETAQHYFSEATNRLRFVNVRNKLSDQFVRSICVLKKKS